MRLLEGAGLRVAGIGASRKSGGILSDKQARMKRPRATPRLPGRLRWFVYWAGRTLQVLGLLLLWWVLMLFPAVENLRIFPYVGVTAAGAVFCVGWVVVRWAAGPMRETRAIKRQKASSHGTNADKEDAMFI